MLLKKLSISIKYLRNNLYLSYFLFLIFIILLFTAFQLTENFPDPDAFYHMKMGQLIWQQGVVQDFPWMQYTVLKDYYIDQHLLYHLLLIPFVNFINPLIGIKLSIILFAGLFILAFALVLRAMKLKGSIVIAGLVAITTPLTFRLNLVKANSLSLMLLFIGVYLAYKKKYLWLFLLSFLFVWAYGGFILLLCVVGLYVLVDLIFNFIKRVETQCIASLRTIFVVITGLAAGLIINPYFPKNLLFYWQQVVQIGIINYQSKIGVGGEWYPYGLVDLFTGCSLITVSALAGLIVFFVIIKKHKSLSWFSLFLFLVGLFLVLKSRRYIEYYVPFAAFFIAASWSDLARLFVGKKYFQILEKFWLKNIFNKIIIFTVVIYVLLIIPAIIIKDYQTNRRDLKSGSSYYQLQKASQWLKENSPENSIVLQCDWDEFPQLFFHNSHNYYIVGLDPTFMYNYNQELYWLWVNITIGKQKEDLPSIIQSRFQASYVFLEKDHTELDRNLQKFSEFSLVYEDEEAKIYNIK